MGETYSHPHIFSSIKDESIIYQSVGGSPLLYAPFFSEKGIDNVLQVIDGPSDGDFTSKFGSPNFLKFGQQHLNIINWLASGGSVVGMRIMPHDATYAHAILDFQVKSVDVFRWEKAGIPVRRLQDEVTGIFYYILPDGTSLYNGAPITEAAHLTALGCAKVATTYKLVRPRIKRTPTPATSLSVIEAYAAQLNGKTTEDGFKHFVVGFFYGNGRGTSFYNDLRAKISNNDTYDDTYTFRCFNLDLYNKQSDGSYTSVEPNTYIVSFDPSAMDLSQESMFIVDVLKRYSKELAFKFFEDAYEELGEALNPDIDPALQDFFFLSERNLFDIPLDANGQPIVIHGRNVISTGNTILTKATAAGANKIYVENPNAVFKGETIFIKGAESAKVSAIDMTLGEITLTANLVSAFSAGDTVMGDSTPEFRQAAVTVDPDDYPTKTLSLSETVIDGLPVFVKGAAKLVQDGVVTGDVKIVSINTSNDTIELESNIDPTGTLISIMQYSMTDIDNSDDIDFDDYIRYSGGTDGFKNTLAGTAIVSKSDLVRAKDSLLERAYLGTLNEDILNKKLWRIDAIIDANFSDSVKTAMNRLSAIIRKDIVFDSDLGFTANPAEAIAKRKKLAFGNFYTCFWSQDHTISDPYSGREVKVTACYDVAGKTPEIEIAHGIHYPIAGPRRGVIAAPNLSWNPSDQWQERLYRAQINYIVDTPKRTMLYGNLTSQTVVSALSDRSHVKTLMRVQREVEELFEDYQFEFITKQQLTNMNFSLNSYLSTWVANEAFRSLSGIVSSNDYDRKRKLARVAITGEFTDILERVAINFTIK